MKTLLLTLPMILLVILSVYTYFKVGYKKEEREKQSLAKTKSIINELRNQRNK